MVYLHGLMSCFSYSINTVIEMPHDRPTVALSFQPTTSHQPLAVSAGKDGKFKIWVLQDHRTVEGISKNKD